MPRVAFLGAAPRGLTSRDVHLHACASPAALIALCRRGRVDVAIAAEQVWPPAESHIAGVDPSIVVLRHVPGETLPVALIVQATALRAARRIEATEALAVDASAHALIGESDAMAGLRGRLRQVADSAGVITIAGPNGTPLLASAQWLHTRTGQGPLLHLDVRQANAMAQLLGGPGTLPAVDLAQGGALVLEYIDEATDAMKAVVRRLAQGAWQASGDDVDRAVHARLFATVRRDPAQPGAISAAAGIPEGWTSRVVRVPTLVERRDDIPRLVAMLHGNSAAHADLGLEHDYQWPGNDEELALRCQLAAAVVDAAAPGQSFICNGTSTLADVERQAVVATLRSQGGHRRRTAEALGIGLRTLGVKLSQWRVARQLPPGI
jgi:DNA-binding NtrC family response regulator